MRYLVFYQAVAPMLGMKLEVTRDGISMNPKSQVDPRLQSYETRHIGHWKSEYVELASQI
jgi:hypothetical protein